MKRIIHLNVLSTLLFSGVIFSCTDPSASVSEIWLPNDIKWEESMTEVPEIDTIRKDAYTGMLAFYGQKLVYGNISLYHYKKTDSIMIAYEAGEILFNGNDCLTVKEMSDGIEITTNKGVLNFTEQGELNFDGKIFKRANNFSQKSKNELSEVFKRFCR